MRELLVLTSLILAPVALAQAPEATLTLSAPAAEALPTRWLTEDAASVRFLGEVHPGPTFGSGQEVTVLVVEGDQARVRRGARFGWVPVEVLAESAPEAKSSAPEAGGFDLSALEDLLQRTE